MSYRFLRTAHRWVGLICSLFLLVISLTGILLATKSWLGVVRPPESEGAEISGPHEIVSLDRVVAAAFAVGINELQEVKHIDRVDYRPKRNVFKVLSKEGYHEVQVCGKTAKVLQVAKRVDQFTENIHDMSIVGAGFREFALPVVGLGLFLLSLTGITIFFNPILRRWQFKRKAAKEPGSPGSLRPGR
jgi:uncharacterized iron-regulated membrane protein